MTAPDVQAEIRFDGQTYEPELDRDRLRIQLERVKACLLDGKPWTLDELMAATGIKSSASLSARVRDLRKLRFGWWDIRSKRLAGGVYVYQIVGQFDADGNRHNFVTVDEACIKEPA